MDRRHTFTGFVEIIKALRAEGGCPWDREQTHDSLRTCMTEEAAELLAAIRIYNQTGNAENMREELGDILLQAVMHSVIAQEEGLFTIDDVIEEVSRKMIRRHPHVFGEMEAENSQQALGNWEEIKRQEKIGKSWIQSPLREIPEELPSLARACKVIKKADKLYGLPEKEDSFWERAEKGLSEMRKVEGSNQKKVQEEKLAEMLWLLAEFAYRKGLAPEQLLSDLTAEKVELFESGEE